LHPSRLQGHQAKKKKPITEKSACNMKFSKWVKNTHHGINSAIPPEGCAVASHSTTVPCRREITLSVVGDIRHRYRYRIESIESSHCGRQYRQNRNASSGASGKWAT